MLCIKHIFQAPRGTLNGFIFEYQVNRLGVFKSGILQRRHRKLNNAQRMDLMNFLINMGIRRCNMFKKQLFKYICPSFITYFVLYVYLFSGGTFPLPPAAAHLCTLLPPPHCFRGPFVHIDILMDIFNRIYLPDTCKYFEDNLKLRYNFSLLFFGISMSDQILNAPDIGKFFKKIETPKFLYPINP